MAAGQNFTSKRRGPRPAIIVLIAVLHIAVLYGLAKALAPDFTGSMEREVVSAFTVDVTAPPDEPPPPPPPPEPEPQPEEGAAGAPGAKATPKPQAAPKVPIPRDIPMPKASSTGTAVTSGARDTGAGTGASGAGEGAGSGRGGSGQGSGGEGGSGGAATKPVHVSGAINSASDYPVPTGGRRARFGTRVVVKVTVGPNGRASDCSVFRASPDAEADRITCRLVVERLRFEPAKDALGNAVVAPFYWQQKWSQSDG